MSAVEVAGLRLRLAQLLGAEACVDEAIREAKAGLAETDEPGTRWQFHHLVGTLLAGQFRLTDALNEWIQAIITAPELSEDSAVAAAQTLDGPRREVLARQIADDLVEAVRDIAARPQASFASQLLWTRMQRLRMGGDGSAPTPPPMPPDFLLTDDLRALLAEEYAAMERLDEALLTLDTAVPATSPRATAVRARLLIRLGRPREVLHLDQPAGLPPEDVAAQSLAASCALAQLAAQQADLAAEHLKPYLDKPGIEPHMAAVVVELARGDYTAADSVLVGLEGLSGRSDDIRLLRAQIHLEPGEIEGIDKGESLLKRLVKPTNPAIARALPMWLRLQREVRSYDDRFGFVWVEWLAWSSDPIVLPALEAATRRSTTYAQDAAIEMLWADQIAPLQSVSAAEHLGIAVDLWRSAGAPDRALRVARRAEELVPGGYTTAIAQALVEQAQVLLREVDQESVTEALSLAQESWRLKASQDAATLWAEALLSPTHDPSPELERRLLNAMHNLSSLQQNPSVAEYRGRLLLRLGEIAAEDRLNYNQQAAEWLLASALSSPDDPYVWVWLPWAFNALGAFKLALEAAEHVRELSGNEVFALVSLIATRINQFGTDPGLDGLIDSLEQADPFWAGWAAGFRLNGAMLDREDERIQALLERKIQEPEFAITIAEARMLVRDPQAASYAETSFNRSLEDSAWGSAARMMLMQGRVDEALELSARAEQARCERPRAVWYVTSLARLISGDLAVEAELEADIRRSLCPGDLRSNLAIDLPLLLRTVPLDSPAAAALDRLRQVSEERLASLEPLPPISPAEDLDEVDAPCLVALSKLWRADSPAHGGWTELVAAGTSVLTWQGDSGLRPVLEAAAAAVLDRAAQRLLDAITLPPADSAGVGAPPTELSGIADWVEAIADDDRRKEGRALLALQIMLSRGVSLDEAVTLAGLGHEEAELDWLAERWAQRVPDVRSWWRFHDHLEATLPKSQWTGVRPALTSRLTELCGMAKIPTIDSRGPQGLLMGNSLIPPDTSAAWVMFSVYVPKIREAILASTGLRVPGFRLGQDSRIDGCLTYTVSDRVAEFAWLRNKVRVLPAAPEEPYDILDPVSHEPLRLVPDPNLTSPDEPADGDETSTGKSVTWLVARHLLAWSQAHLAELYFPYDVNDVVRVRPDLATELDEPSTIIKWLDASRQAIEAERKLDVDLMASVLLGASASRDPAEVADRAVAALAPWDPMPEAMP